MTADKSQIVSRTIEGAGLATVTASAFGQWVAENHDIIWSIGVIGGFSLTLIGVATNVYFGIQKNRREAEIHRMEIKRIVRSAKQAGKT